MIQESGTSYPNGLHGGVQNSNHLYTEGVDMSSSSVTRGPETQLKSFLCSLSIMKEKVDQVQSYVNIFVPQRTTLNHDSNSSMALASMGNIIQEIIVTASSMMFNCQQMSLGSPQENNHSDNYNNHSHHIASTSHMGVENNGQSFFDGEGFYNLYADYITSTLTPTTNIDTGVATRPTSTKGEKISIGKNRIEAEAYDIIELEATDLLAKYTHYCQICAKGFKRDANLRMHMRAHGDEYKSRASLSNPMKKTNDHNNGDHTIKVPRKYSCPHEGCRWNKKHVKFQPLKSIICVKNHYKRSHCPKMYVCKRCNRKQFSVLSDLRTHEKHCGDLKWQCSCGTTFSRKDKLMGHVALFIGHTPLVNPLGTLDNKLDNQLGVQIQFQEC